MDKYRLEGMYDYEMLPTGQGRLEGELEVGKLGEFEAEIIDHGSTQSPVQIIKGHFYTFEDIDFMQFLKYPRRENLANLAYLLTKEGPNAIEGTYRSAWGALPYKIQYDVDKNVYSAQIDLRVAHIGAGAEINIYKK